MRWLRALVLDNAALKVLSVLLAVLIHLVVRRDSVREFNINVAAAVSALPKGQVFVGTLPSEVEVRVRGRWSGIRELIVDHSRRLSIDLSAYRDGERYAFDLRDVQMQIAARDVEVLAVRPAALDVRLQRLARRRVAVQVSTTGDPAQGFGIGPKSVTVNPSQVEISGPASVVRGIRRVRVAPIDLTGADSDIRIRARLLGVGGRHVKLSVDEVNVQVRLEEHEVSRKLTRRPIVLRGCPEGMRCVLKPTETTVTVRGKARAVLAFIDQPPDNLVFADVGPAISRKQRSVRLQLPALKGLSLNVRPAVAKFKLLGEIPAD